MSTRFQLNFDTAMASLDLQVTEVTDSEVIDSSVTPEVDTITEKINKIQSLETEIVSIL